MEVLLIKIDADVEVIEGLLGVIQGSDLMDRYSWANPL